MADRRPLVTPGRIDEIDDADRAIVSGIVRTAAGDLTFEDAVTGPKTLAQLAAGGGGIGGTTGAIDNALLRADGVGGATVQASPVIVTDAGAVTGVTTLTASGAISASNLSGANTGDQTITLTGDVTGSGTGSFAATIANDAVTFAKMQNVTAASRLLGRGDSGAGDPQEITLGAGLVMTGTSLSASGGGGDVTAAANFANDNRLVRSDGTLKGVQASGITVDDSANVTGVGTLASGAITVGSGDITLTTGNVVLSQAGATVDGIDLTALNTSVSNKITGPASATDEAIVRYDATTGKLAQNSVVTISDAGVLTLPSAQAINMQTSTLVSLGYTTISPTAIAAQQNDYSPTSWSGADIVRLTFTGSQTITGFSATATATSKLIENIDTVDSMTIPHESASSAAASRVTCPNAVSLIIPPGGSVRIVYDATSARWRPTVVNNGAIVLPAPVLHEVSRSAQISNITTTPVFPGYDVTIKAINSSYWSYSGGTWTCLVAHDSTVEAELSGQYSGAVSSQVYLDVTYAQGGAYNLLYRQRTSCYSNITPDFFLRSSVTRTWVVNDTMRIYISCASGDCDVFAASNLCRIKTA